MTTTDFTTAIQIDQSPQQVYDAILNVSAWWHGEVIGTTEKLGDEFSYRMRDMHYSKQKLVEIIPNQKVVWLVTESDLSFTKSKSEWTGTKLVFEISGVDGKTELRFTHQGLVPEFECYGGCSNGWTMLIQESLLSLITTGKGVEVFG